MSAPSITTEQMQAVMALLSNKHLSDLAISLLARVPEEQVARLRASAPKKSTRASRR